MSQVFVVVAAGSVLSFIIRELGEPALAGWVIQVRPLLPILLDTQYSQSLGPSPHAIRLVATCWSIV